MASVDESLGVAVVAAHRVLPAFHHTLHSAILPFYAHVFRICTAGHCEARSFQGAGTCSMENIEMQSMGWFGI